MYKVYIYKIGREHQAILFSKMLPDVLIFSQSRKNVAGINIYIYIRSITKVPNNAITLQKFCKSWRELERNFNASLAKFPQS